MHRSSHQSISVDIVVESVTVTTKYTQFLRYSYCRQFLHEFYSSWSFFATLNNIYIKIYTPFFSTTPNKISTKSTSKSTQLFFFRHSQQNLHQNLHPSSPTTRSTTKYTQQHTIHPKMGVNCVDLAISTKPVMMWQRGVLYT